MFKIVQQFDDKGLPIDRYTLIAYYFDRSSNFNHEAWSVSNLTEKGVANLLHGRNDESIEDQDFAFVVVKSGNGPAILTTDGNLLPSSVKKELPIRREHEKKRRSLFQGRKKSQATN